jgi:hypothetical protein
MRRVALLALAPLLASCTTLTVKVDVLDPSYVATSANESGMRAAAIKLAAGDHSEAERTFARIMQDRRTLWDSCHEKTARAGEIILQQLPAAKADAGKRDIAQIRSTATNPDALNTFNAAAGRYHTALFDADAAVHAESFGAALDPAQSATPLPADLVERLGTRRRAYDQTIQTALTSASRCSTESVAGVLITLDDAAQQQVSDLQQTLTSSAQSAAYSSLIGGGTLLTAQREAFYVVKADERLWANKFNKAYGVGVGGGTDVVIKLNDTADFTVKGLVFDARSTAEMVKKVGVSTIGLIASAYGAPTSIAAAGGSSDAGKVAFSQTDKVASADLDIAVEQTRQRAYQDALSRLASDVLAEWPVLTGGDDSKSGDAAKRVKTVYASAKDVVTAADGAPAPAAPPAKPATP